MSLCFTSLNSGSNGNCYYVGNDQDAILIDVGISCREIEKRLIRLQLKIDLVKAIFISHEHSDHIKGLYRLATKYNVPVYISKATLQASGLSFPYSPILHFDSSAPITVGSLHVIPFRKYHDAADPYSFVVEDEANKIGIFTDIGRVCDQLVYYFRQCDAAFLETNYDEELLANGRYPYFLKNRIKGGHGHLSNKQALELFLAHRSDRLSHLLLAHLSKDNNHPNLVTELFVPHARHTQIIVAPRDQETALYYLHDVIIPTVSR